MLCLNSARARADVAFGGANRGGRLHVTSVRGEPLTKRSSKVWPLLVNEAARCFLGIVSVALMQELTNLEPPDLKEAGVYLLKVAFSAASKANILHDDASPLPASIPVQGRSGLFNDR